MIVGRLPGAAGKGPPIWFWFLLLLAIVAAFLAAYQVFK